MSGLSYPDFSGRFVRIKYLAVSTALLVAASGHYGIDSFNLFKIINFRISPPEYIVFFGIWLFAIFNIYGFWQRYHFEKTLIPNSLLSLRIMLERAKTFFEKNLNAHRVFCTEVSNYGKYNIARPLPKFDQSIADEVSSNLLNKHGELLPNIRYLCSQCDNLEGEIFSAHFVGADNKFKYFHRGISKLLESHEMVHSLAIDLSSVRIPMKPYKIWPILSTNDRILTKSYDRASELVDELLKTLPTREKLERSLNFTLSFNIPFWICISLFLSGSIEFIRNNWDSILGIVK